MSEQDYNRGFADALLFVAKILRRSATIVEQTDYAQYDHNGGTLRGIKRLGNAALSSKYREIADILETATKASDP